MLEKIMESEKADRINELKSKISRASMSLKFWDLPVKKKEKEKVKKIENTEQMELDF